MSFSSRHDTFFELILGFGMFLESMLISKVGCCISDPLFAGLPSLEVFSAWLTLFIFCYQALSFEPFSSGSLPLPFLNLLLHGAFIFFILCSDRLYFDSEPTDLSKPSDILSKFETSLSGVFWCARLLTLEDDCPFFVLCPTVFCFYIWSLFSTEALRSTCSSCTLCCGSDLLPIRVMKFFKSLNSSLSFFSFSSLLFCHSADGSVCKLRDWWTRCAFRSVWGRSATFEAIRWRGTTTSLYMLCPYKLCCSAFLDTAAWGWLPLFLS